MPLGPLNLVAAGTEHIDVAFIYIDRHLSESLHRIGMEQNSVLFGNLADLFDGLNGSDLVVGKHHRDQDGIRADGLLQLIQLYNTVLIHIQVGDLKTASSPDTRRYEGSHDARSCVVMMCFPLLS